MPFPPDPILQAHRKMKICIVAHFAFGALTGGRNGHIGGVERQTSLMARWLAGRGHDVSIITWDEGQDDGMVIDGVRVLKVCGRDEGLPGLRFLTPRWVTLNAALRRADAEIYYQNCGEYVTGQVALWTRIHGRKFVYAVASDPDCMAGLPLMKTLRERVLYRYGLRNADRIIVQTRSQKRLLRAEFALESEMIPMPCPGPDEAEFVPPFMPSGGRGRILWIGRIDRVKRPDRFLAVVEACPDLEFDLVGPAGDETYAREILAKASLYGNLRIHGGVARDLLPGIYKNSACLCSTSEVEGFPNTFLEAWSYGIPVVSTIDPDSIIAERGLGMVGRDVPELIASLRRLLESGERWTEISRKARSYFIETHHFPKVMPGMEKIFIDLSGRNDRGEARCSR